MGELRCTLKQAQDGVAVPLDEATTIIIVPAVAQVTLKGRAFEAGRTFLLPRAINALNEVWRVATRMQAKYAVAVAHVEAVDTDPDALSKARATIAQSWLAGETAPWLKQFETSIPEAQRWGSREDKHLLSVALGDAAVPPPNPGETGDHRVRAFQALAGVKVDGISGPVTRGKLVERYFAVSRTALLNAAKQPGNGITLLETKVAAHGAGANFTLQQVSDAKASAESASASSAETTINTSSESETKATDPTEINPDTPAEPEARIDFMFFFSETGPEPAPGAPDGPEFLEWVQQTELQRVATVASPAGAHTLFVELWDKALLTRHKGAKYTLTGPESFSGTTDSQGRIEHDDVLPGDYALTLTLEFFEDADKITDEYKASLVVQGSSERPQIRGLGAVPSCELAQIKGLLFDTSKAFLLPEAVTALKEIRQVYERHNGSELLVVGHTDTMGDTSFNDPLSLERAKATLAYLQDDVDTWLTFYEIGVPEARRWDETEDARMQELVNDPSLTRSELIAAYMALDGAELDASEFTINGTAHGCGENFPLDDTGEELDTAPSGDKEDALDRRVELFFFDPEFGIVPKPAREISKQGSTQYLQWRKLAKVVSEGVVTIPLPAPGPAETLPAGCFGFDLSFPTPGIMPTLRRFAESAKAAQRTVGIFAHTDKVGSEAYNKSLSDRRGKATFAIMTGNLELFESVASEEGWQDDVYQSMLRGLGCNPGPTDGKFGPLSERAVADFQRDYNANLFHTKERQRTASDLEVNGKLDDLTRTALRDAYVAHFSTGLSDADFQGPKFSGCGEFVPISDDADHNRRVTLTLYPERPSKSAFPCVQGDAAACDLDDQKPRRCRFYRKVVLEDEQLPPPTLADFEWLKLADGNIHLSAVTSAPDDQEARFTVHKTTTEPANPLPNSALQPGPRVELGKQVGGSVAGVAALGVIECKWSAPDGFDPFDVEQWLVNLGMPSTGDDDESDEEPDATPEAAGSDDYFHPPLFCVDFDNAWAYSPPPGERLARFLLRNDAGGPVSGLALHSDGFAEAFDTDGRRIAKGRDELVIRLALNPDSDIDEEQA